MAALSGKENPLDLDAIRERNEMLGLVGPDVPALCDEVERLRAVASAVLEDHRDDFGRMHIHCDACDALDALDGDR